MEETVLLRMTDITKTFPGVRALDHVSLEVKAGTVHALMGENGAGKSTLMKCLFGIYNKDSGHIYLEGREVNFNSSKEALMNGVAMVHQELNQALKRTVMDNLWLGRYPKIAGFIVDEAKMLRDTKAIFEELGIDVDPKRIMSTMPVSQRQMVEIAKAVSYHSKVIVFDEPTSSLTEEEVEHLFKIINMLRDRGMGIIYISHKMAEIKRISDEITVMRDGQYVDTLETPTAEISEVIRLMVGRTIYEEPKTKSMCPPDAPVVLEAEHLHSLDVKDVSFQLHKGEILGFAGLVGAGRTETMRLVCGADPMDAGVIRVNGKEAKIRSPKDAVRYGIGYLSEDRKRYGLCLNLSVTDNTVLPSLEQLFRGPFVNDGKADRHAQDYVEKIRTKTPNTRARVGSLSGGNQQKVVISKWLLRDCDVLIFDEPTRGIDVGAKSEIYKLMTQLAEEGKAIIMISSDMPELLRLSDRVIVMCEGHVTGELDISEATQESIMTYATKREEG